MLASSTVLDYISETGEVSSFPPSQVAKGQQLGSEKSVSDLRLPVL